MEQIWLYCWIRLTLDMCIHKITYKNHGVLVDINIINKYIDRYKQIYVYSHTHTHIHCNI